MEEIRRPFNNHMDRAGPIVGLRHSAISWTNIENVFASERP